MALYIGIKNLIGKGAAWLRSKWATIVTQLLATFRYRVAGGADNALLPESNGRAVIDTIYGNTVKWNQLASLNVGDYTYNPSFTHPTIVGNKFNIVFNNASQGFTTKVVGIASHEYYVHVKIDADKDLYYYENGVFLGQRSQLDKTTIISGDGTNRITAIASASNFTTVDYALQIIDLTQLFGTDAEIAAALGISVEDITTAVGVAAFEAWLALNVGTQDYYPYDEGSLISFKGQGVKSVGFNQWDGQYYTGKYWSDNGTLANMSGQYCVFTPIIVIPSQKYYIRKEQSCTAKFFDSNMNLLLKIDTPTVIRAPSNARFLCLNFSRVPNEICVNFSDTNLNGTYKPYWYDILDLDVTKIYGKVNGQGSYQQCYPNGMLSAGSVQDTLTASEAVVNLGSLDMGDLGWGALTDNRFYANMPDESASPINNGINSICSVYDRTTYTPMQDKWFVVNDSSLSSGKRVFIRDTSHSTAPTSSDNWVNGIMLYYKLATPITYTDLIYSEDGGVTGTPLTEFKYKVDKYSTEELIVPASVAGEPTSTALVADIDYQAK